MTVQLIQLTLTLMTFCIIGTLRQNYFGLCLNNDSDNNNALTAAIGYGTATQQLFNCPLNCICRNISDFSALQTEVICTQNVSIHSLPFTAKMLTINLRQQYDINLEDLLKHLVNHTKNVQTTLTQLALNECNITTLKNITFSRLTQLEKLDLSQNHIDEPINLRDLNSLMTLDLSQNKIKFINDNFNLNLKNLNLSFNALINITTLGNLSQLEYLDISSNYLSKLTNDIFSQLINLQYLNLSNNKIELLNSNCFNNLLHLQQLDVSHNHLTSVELQSLPNLARLTLSGNPHLGDLLIGTGRRLQAVDASRTGLEFVPPALTHSVRTLRLSSNAIHVVRCGDFDSYPLLQLLDFTDNALQLIEEDALGRLEMLKMLFLNENKLTFVPKSLPESIRILHLERNVIENLTDSDFKDLVRLEVLLLNDNNINVLRKGVFDDLKSLFTLDLSGNPISVIEAGALSNVNNLEILRLAGLPLAALARDTSFPIYAVDHLISLDLTASPGLARILLADEAALASIKFLQELSLADAGLIHLRSDLMNYLPQLHCLRLNGNRLDCSELQWLAQWMRLQNRNEDKNVMCFGPPHLAGTLLVDLQEETVVKPLLNASRQSRKSNHSKKNNNLTLKQTSIPSKNNNLNVLKTERYLNNLLPNKTTHNPPANYTFLIKTPNITVQDQTEKMLIKINKDSVEFVNGKNATLYLPNKKPTSSSTRRNFGFKVNPLLNNVGNIAVGIVANKSDNNNAGGSNCNNITKQPICKNTSTTFTKTYSMPATINHSVSIEKSVSPLPQNSNVKYNVSKYSRGNENSEIGKNVEMYRTNGMGDVNRNVSRNENKKLIKRLNNNERNNGDSGKSTTLNKNLIRQTSFNHLGNILKNANEKKYANDDDNADGTTAASAISLTNSEAINIPFSKILIMKNSSSTSEINDTNLLNLSTAASTQRNSSSVETIEYASDGTTLSHFPPTTPITFIATTTSLAKYLINKFVQRQNLFINTKDKEDIMRDEDDNTLRITFSNRTTRPSFHFIDAIGNDTAAVAKKFSLTKNDTHGNQDVIKSHNKSLSATLLLAQKTNLNAGVVASKMKSSGNILIRNKENRTDTIAIQALNYSNDGQSDTDAKYAHVQTKLLINNSKKTINSPKKEPIPSDFRTVLVRDNKRTNYFNRTLIGEVKATNREIVSALEASLHLAANQDLLIGKAQYQQQKISTNSGVQNFSTENNNKSTREFLRDEKVEYASKTLTIHPGIVIATIICVCLCISILIASKLRRTYRHAMLFEERCSDNNLLSSYTDNIEVNQLPHVTDLW